ncbi:protein serine/threonine phosphatase [Aureococcus anophagefferens]|uniref:Protein serine/threonine phosphatase n=2 Tax=Aureococcus anophagefferens TaxID=44056 RepID=A0ABR1G8W3_AURAN
MGGAGLAQRPRRLSFLDDLDESQGVAGGGMGSATSARFQQEKQEGKEKRVHRPDDAAAAPEKRPRLAEDASTGGRLMRTFCGVAETIGKKRTMEDRSSVIQLADGRVFVGVYDGHAGPCAAEHAAATLHTRLDVAPPAGGSSNAAMWEAAYEQCEREILRRFRDGTTACTAVLRGEELSLANVGDSRCVLGGGGRRRRLSERLTTDHKPDVPAERARVEAHGGRVVHRGAYRVFHESCPLLLAVSRSLGDFALKKHPGLISATPEVTDRSLKPGWDDFAIFATDGLWDVVSDADAVGIVYDTIGEALASGSVTQELCTEAASKCIQAARKRCTMDNVLVLVLCFQWRPKSGAAA